MSDDKYCITLDVFESEALENHISQDIGVMRFPLNENGMADIFWTANDTRYQWENKATTEILGDFDHVEEQLQKQAPNADYSGLIVRGVVVPSGGKTLAMEHIRTKNDWFVVKRTYKFPYSRYRAWLVAIRRAGITVVEVGNLVGTARHIVQEYKQTIDPKTKTLQHQHKPRIVVATKNPHIRGLMGLSVAYGLGLGEEKATRLIDRYTTLGALLAAAVDNPKSLQDVPGIGPTIAEKLKVVSD